MPRFRPGQARITVQAPAAPGPRSGLPDVGRLQRVQRRFIKALHGVATRSRSSEAGWAPRTNSPGLTGYRSRRPRPEVPASAEP